MTLINALGRPSKKPTFGLHQLRTIIAVRQQRRKLANLDQAALRDLGLTHKDVQAELKRPAWDVPGHWRA